RDRITVAVIIWLTTAMTADVLIAIVFIIYFKSETKVKLSSSKRLIHRLTVLALKTGSFTAITAVLMLTVYFNNNQSNMSLIFGYCVGRVYSLTLLYNLNIREKLQPDKLCGWDTMMNSALEMGSIQRLGLTTEMTGISSNDSANQGTEEEEEIILTVRLLSKVTILVAAGAHSHTLAYSASTL
ncbi:hypothetical protein K435DRAFT_812198, partial [Dendrothele bispora CBS 962.96]